ncbi:hypothetical protein V2J09_005251 [Rumex salicifolius]
MSSSISALNPYAESYVPISKRNPSSENQDDVAVSDVLTSGSTVDSKLKCQKADNPQGNNTFSSNEVKFTDEEYEMDLAYLQMSFPGMSDQSLVDVYTVNDGDLEASLEMLSQLEVSVETPDGLPDALGIGDVPEPLPSGERSTNKPKNVTGESRATSASSNLVVPS